jgi:vacuolar-type H+-ATPase subunit C/Vma6
MAGAGERSYVYAKACGIIGKSFVGRRIAALHPVSRLSELDRLIFGSGARELPERELLPDLEKRLIRRSTAQIISIVDSFKNPPELLSMLLKVYEYSDLKTALALIAEGRSDAPQGESTALGRFGTVRFDSWPNVSAMLGGTEFEFLLDRNGELKKEFDGVSLETALDRHYYERLWKSILALGKGDRRAAETITAEEIALRNCAWMLRLRTYYGMKAGEVRRHLITVQERPDLDKDALEALEYPLDSRAEWERWNRVSFLNSETSPSRRVFQSEGGAGIWHADPRYFQNTASEYLYKLALRDFRRKPSSIDTSFCFIKLKQFEEDLLTSDAEGLGMGMSSRDVFGMLESASSIAGSS